MVRSIRGTQPKEVAHFPEDIGLKKRAQLAKPLPPVPSSEKNNIKPLPEGKIGDRKTPCAAKTAAVALFGKAKNEYPKALNWKQKFISYTAEKFLNLSKGKYNFDAINSESKGKLSVLTGNPNLAEALTAASPMLTDVLLKVISGKLEDSDKFYKEGLEKALKEQHQLISDCVNATLLKMMANIASKTKHSKKLEKASLLDMISYLSGFTGNRLQNLHKQIAKIEKIENKKEQKQKLKALLNSFKKDILHELLPNKEKDIVLPKGKLMGAVGKHIYDAIADALPELILENEQYIGHIGEGMSLLAKMPFKKDRDGLENINNLNSTIETVSENIVPIAQSFIGKNKEEYTLKMYQAIDKVLPGVLELSAVRDLVNEFVNPKDSTKPLLSIIPTVLKEFLSPIIVSIASWTNIKEDVLTGALSNLTMLISFHFKNQIESYDAQLVGYDKLSEEGQEHRLDEVFGEFVGNVLVTVGIDPLEISEPARNILLKQTYNLYQMLKSPLDVQQNYRLKLHQLVGVNIAKLKEDLNKYNQGADARALENMMGFAAEKINEAIQGYISEEADHFPKLINDILPEKKLSEEDQNWLSSVFKGIVTSDDRGIKDLWNYTSDALHSTLMKLFVDVAHQFPESNDPKIAKKVLIPLMMKKLIGILGTNLTDMQGKIRYINETVPNENDRKLEIRKLFMPMAEEFLKLAGPDALAVLPIPETFKPTLMDTLKETILPDLLGEMYVGITKWEFDKQQNQEKLMHLFKSDNPAMAAKAIARFASDLLPAAITSPEKEANKKVFEKFSEFMLKQPGERAKAIYEYIDNHPQDMTYLIKENFAILFDEELGINKIAFPAMEEFIETAVLKVMSNVFSKINEKQNQNPNLLVDTGLNVIELINKHLTELYRIMQDQKKSLASHLDTAKLFNAFEDIHPALSRRYPKLPKEKKEELLNEHFLVPLTGEVLKFAGINSLDDLPLPEMSPAKREKLFELLKTDLGPSIINSMISSINLDKMMISMLELVNEGIENPEKDIKLPAELENDKTQQKLNQACGDLVLNLTRLIPNTAVGTFLANEKIRRLPAESIGKMLRAQLMNTNLLQAINKNIVSSLTSLDEQITVDVNGELVIPENLHFDVSDFLKAETDKEKQLLRHKFVKELTRTFRHIIVFRIKDFFAANWKEMQEKFDQAIKDKFGENALEVKLAIDKIFRLIFINIIGSAFQLMTLPFLKLMGFFANLHFRRKSQQISDTIHMSIHKDLIFKLVEMTFKTFNEEPPPQSQNT